MEGLDSESKDSLDQDYMEQGLCSLTNTMGELTLAPIASVELFSSPKFELKKEADTDNIVTTELNVENKRSSPTGTKTGTHREQNNNFETVMKKAVGQKIQTQLDRSFGSEYESPWSEDSDKQEEASEISEKGIEKGISLISLHRQKTIKTKYKGAITNMFVRKQDTIDNPPQENDEDGSQWNSQLVTLRQVQTSRQKAEHRQKMHKAKHAIMTGFWLVSNDEQEVMVFITRGEDGQTYYLELYHFQFEDIMHIGKHTLFEANVGEQVEFKVILSDERNYCSIIAQFYNAQEYKDLRLFLVQSHELIMEESNLRNFDSFVTNRPGNFAHEDRRIENSVVKGAIQEVKLPQNLLINMHNMQGHHQSVLDHFLLAFCKEKLCILYSDTVSEFFVVDLNKVFTQSTLQPLTKMQEKQFEEVAKVVNLAGLNNHGTDRKIIGFHMVLVNTATIIMSNGNVLLFKIFAQSEQKYVVTENQLKIPILEGFKQEEIQMESSYLTKLYYKKRQQPVIIVRLKQNTNYLYFSQTNTIEGDFFSPPYLILGDQYNFKIQKVFGRFLIGEFKRENQTKLIELGGKDYQDMNSVLELSPPGFSYQIESDFQMDNFLVKYRQNHRSFHWERFEKQNFVTHKDHDEISHVVSDYLLTIRYCNQDCPKWLIVQKNGSRRQIHYIHLQGAKAMRNFFPKLSPDHKLILLLITTQKIRNDFREGRFQQIILVNLELEVAKTLIEGKFQGKAFRWAGFQTSSRILVQSIEKIFAVDFSFQETRQQLPKTKSFTEKIVLGKLEKRQRRVSLANGFSPIHKKESSDYNLAKKITILIDECKQTDKVLFFLDTKKMVVNYVSALNLMVGSIELAQLQPPDDVKVLHGSKSSKELKTQRELVLPSLENAKAKSALPTIVVKHSKTHLGNEKDLSKQENSMMSQATFQDSKNQSSDVHLVDTPLFKFGIPEELSQITTVMACRVYNQPQFYVLLSNPEFSWIKKFDLMNGNEDNDLDVQDSGIITVEGAFEIKVVYQNKVAIQTKSEIIIYNFDSKTMDFRIKFSNAEVYEMTCSMGLMAIGRHRQSLLFKFDDPSIDIIEPLRKRENTRSKKHERDEEMNNSKPINTLNDLLHRFQKNYPNIFEKDSAGQRGYLCIDESLVEWDSRIKLVPISIKFPDQIFYRKDDMALGGAVPAHYKQNNFLQLIYSNDISIWDILIRQGLINNKVEITQAQIQRVFFPVINNENRNLLHLLCKNNIQALQKVFMLELSSCLDPQNKKFPFFKDFTGKSPLDYAFDRKDDQIFNFLLKKMIELQEGFESSHLIEGWLESAMIEKKDVNCVFDSKLCTMQLSKETLGANQDYDVHPDDSTYSGIYYRSSMIELLNNQDAYASLFQTKFPAIYRGDYKNEPKEQLFSMDYVADYYLGNEQSEEKIFGILKVLSQSENMSYFRSRYIRRMINFQWHNTFKAAFYRIILCENFIFLLILVNTSMINRTERKYCISRIGLNAFIALQIFYLMIIYDLPRLRKQGLKWFNSSWNIFTLLFLLCFIFVWVFDGWSCLTKTTKPEEELRMLLGGKGRNKESSGEYEMLPQETRIRSWTRIGYAGLVIFDFIKVLQLLQLHRDVGFLVKMIEVCFVELIPFFFLFVMLLIIFSYSLFALALPIAENDATDDYFNFDFVAMQYFFHVLRTALGDFQPGGYKRMRSPTLYVAWIIWIVLVLINTVIFLNFIIAVVSDVFAQVMETRAEQAIQKKCQFICAIQDSIDNQSKKTGIIVTRMKAQSQSENWTGLVNQIKSMLSQHEHAFMSYTERIVSQQIDNKTRPIEEKLITMDENIKHILDKINAIQPSPNVRTPRAPSRKQSFQENTLPPITEPSTEVQKKPWFLPSQPKQNSNGIVEQSEESSESDAESINSTNQKLKQIQSALNFNIVNSQSLLPAEKNQIKKSLL